MFALTPMLLAVLAQSDDPIFVEVTGEALPGVTTTCGSPNKDWIMEVNGGGLALGDLDNDGDIDLVIVDGSTFERIEAGTISLPPRVFLNEGDGTFTKGGKGWTLPAGRWGTGAALGDVDGDGFLDLVVTNWGANRLYLNAAGQGFVDATHECGLDGDTWSTSAAFLDYDHDGHLDLYVTGYLVFDRKVTPPRGTNGCLWKGHSVMCGPEGLHAEGDRLYKGDGNGKFVDVTEAAGISAATPGFGLGVMTLDADADGDTDLYVTNDSMPNFLWENQGDGTFKEVAFRRGVGHDNQGREQAGMGIACADWNHDGRPDLFVTNFSGESNVMYRSSRGKSFRERSGPMGLGGPSLTRLGWGTGFGDLNLDGHLDLFVLNGHVYPIADHPGTDTTYAQADQVFLGASDRFHESVLAETRPRVSRAGALADLDRDGDLDLVALSVEGPVHVFRNETPKGRHWIAFALEGSGANTFGLGARVELVFGVQHRWAEMRTSGGFQASVPAEVHFGLGTVDKLDAVVVHWPDGKQQRIEAPAVDQLHRIPEDTTR